ncbi:hypothetical protein DH2020_013706 [Rehmannia glutinosa]|uniref:LRAT domain-containing protein n=1 Tax=Rehmannia glutinosa TaxID=99300 RepID=A0ABR0X311_REHGL
MVGVLSNKIGRDELKPGDHIYSWRHSYLYAHHEYTVDLTQPIGIYVGDGNVIHFTRGRGRKSGPEQYWTDSFSAHLHRIPQTPPAQDVVTNQKMTASSLLASNVFFPTESYINSSTVSHQPYFSLKLAAARARLPVRTHRRRTLPRRISPPECVGRSGQAASFLAAASAIVSSPLRFMTTGFGGLTAMGCGIYCISRIVSDIGVRRDVMKIPVERLVDRSGLGEPEAAATENHNKE